MYLTGVSNDLTRALHRPDLGLMVQPGNSYHRQVEDYPRFAIDNGAYGGKFDEARWLRCMDGAALHHDRLLFVVVPDRFDPTDIAGNLRATLDMWGSYSHEVLDRGLPAAFVCQNGCTPDDIPYEASCAFIGGDTKWKLSEQAWACVAAAKAHGQWAHIGRVNSLERLSAAAKSNADSADGTFVRHGPKARMVAEMVGWLDQLNAQPHLALFGPAA